MGAKLLPWQNYESWRRYGITKGYRKRTVSSLSDSKNKAERSWYNKGQGEGWARRFDFNMSYRSRLPYSSFSEWMQYGIQHGYKKRNSNSLNTSRKREEKSWFRKGRRTKWANKFPFAKIFIPQFDSFSEWKKYGVEHGYQRRNPASLSESKSEKERKWYDWGVNRKYTKRFEFERVRISLELDNFEEWEKHGMQHGYQRRNPASLSLSRDKYEKAWYKKGIKEKWVSKFSFSRKLFIRSERKLESFIKDNPQGNYIASLAATGNYIGVANILIKLFPGRFASAADLARSLPGAVKRIGHSLVPFTLEGIRKFRERGGNLSSEVQYDLDELLYQITVDHYQTQFNRNPKRTVNEIKQYAKDHHKDVGMRQLVSRVLDYYQSIYKFNIPGQGSLEDNL